MNSLTQIFKSFISRIKGIDTSMNRNYLRLPKDLFFEIVEELRLQLTDLFIANK